MAKYGKRKNQCSTNIWHDANEIPILGKWILAQRYDKSYVACMCDEYIISKEEDMAFISDYTHASNSSCSTYYICKWSYIEEI